MSNKGKYDSPLTATLKGITDLFGKKENEVQLPENINLTGKTVLFIGSSAGLGLAAAKRIAAAGANLIMAVRSGIPETGDALIIETGNPDITMLNVDLLDFESIDKFLTELEQLNPKIDILISNAAMVPLKSRKTPQGLEEMFMVNYLSAFYLINRILNMGMMNSEYSKIIITSSESHRNPKEYDWESFGVYHEYGINETVARYGYFKLLLTTFANELSRRLESEGKHIHVRSLCPGPVNSNIAREAPGWMQPLLKAVFSLFFRSPEKASDPIIYFVAEPRSGTKPMDYLFLMQQKPMDDKTINEENGKILWDKSERLIYSLGYQIN